MSTLNIKEEIKKLVELQEIDKEIFALSKEKTGHPRLLEELAREFDAKKASLKSLEETKQKLYLKQKEKEGELASKEENIKKTQNQLGQLKTNKEYQVKLTEIESLKADKSLIEEEILNLMDNVDTMKNDIEKEKKTLEADEKSYNEKKGIALNRAKEVETLLSGLDGKRRILISGVDKKILARYEHILHGKNGLAIVKVDNNSCAGCFMHVPPQVENEIRMHENIITCESCARILYLQEDLQS
ncbi:MAG: C4-type zinc ribbon domain-containing protein [Candidatus Omnitrophota bacterium]